MRKLIYMGIEKLQARYTYQLTDWNERVFKRRGIDYIVVPGQEIDNSMKINTGQVLDAFGRPYFSMSQIMNLVQMMRNGEVTGEDVIFFEDLFAPGFESLPYILCQIPEDQRPQIYVRCLAQAIDPDDFVHVWGMSKWMSNYEAMVNNTPNVHILATNEEMIAHMKIANWTAPMYNISGLAFGKEEVQERGGPLIPFASKKRRVVFGARFDQEKQPDFFMDLVERVFYKDNDIEFAICSGGPLKSNNEKFITRARVLEEQGKLNIYENLKKNEYYDIVKNSRVMFNCALQDWVSNTVSEADALGTNVLYPAYRSFPETFANDATRLYVPWSLDDAESKLMNLIENPSPNIGKISDWTNGTIDRCIDIMEGNGEQWRRDDIRYRDYVSKAKY